MTVPTLHMIRLRAHSSFPWLLSMRTVERQAWERRVSLLSAQPSSWRWSCCLGTPLFSPPGSLNLVCCGSHPLHVSENFLRANKIILSTSSSRSPCSSPKRAGLPSTKSPA